MKPERDILQVLKTELEFLEKGGYRDPDLWRPMMIFEDSPICIHPDRSEQLNGCSQCPLMIFVPEARRNASVPCRHIPLTPEGFTLEGLYRWATQNEIEDALRQWLKSKIEQIEAERRVPAA